MRAALENLRGMVGAAHVRPADTGDAIGGVPASVIVEPATEQEVAAVLRQADAEALAVIPRGGGTKLDWGNPPWRTDLVLSTGRLNRVVEHAWADMTATVEAGCPVAHLQGALAQHGQRLAVDVLWPERATVGGILSTNDSGALRLRYGGLRDLVIGVTLALADGSLARSGGKVVKNVAGYDLPKLATGALGTLGVITEATFRLHPLPSATRTLTIRAGDADEAERLMLAIQDSRLAHSALQARLATHAAPEVDVLLEGTAAGIASQEATIRELAGTASVSEGSTDVWATRQDLWPRGGGGSLGPPRNSPPGGEGACAIAKVSILPSDFAETVASIVARAESAGASWSAVVQATGIGWLRVDAAPEVLGVMLGGLRSVLESHGGSLVVLRQPPGVAAIEVWGSPGDRLPLMRALKQQLDPRSTLNPGRFVGGL